VVVLYEVGWGGDAGVFGKGAGVVAFEEEASLVAEDFWFKNQDVWDFGADDVHLVYHREYYGLNSISDFCR